MQKELQQKYNPDSLFQDTKKIVVEKASLPIETKKESLLKRFVNFIKNLISKNN